MTDPLAIWHLFIADRDIAHLDELLADDVTFRPPTYWKTRSGKPVTMLILSSVMEIFEDFEYHRQWINENDWALEFTARIGDLGLKGVDLITLQDGKITELEVVIRPPNAVEALRQEMAVRLATQGGS
ncbi:MAG: nuclear transport factor 2 family protein [Acidimicrobiia bacterium]|nr:nuclear transport factor 2 family protein [Acidimicrobiia bacterium]MDH5503241.1 nuclear transport factor 2 family protein [Acidimicrobiia bacterium]